MLDTKRYAAVTDELTRLGYVKEILDRPEGRYIIHTKHSITASHELLVSGLSLSAAVRKQNDELIDYLRETREYRMEKLALTVGEASKYYIHYEENGEIFCKSLLTGKIYSASSKSEI